MARRTETQPHAPPPEGRLRAVLVLLFVFGLPALLMSIYLSTRGAWLHPPAVEQPGGAVRGAVRAAHDGRPLEGVAVVAFLVSPDGEAREGPRTRTGDDGEFALELPPHTGIHLVRAGGGPWRHAHEDVALAGGAEPLRLAFALEPAARVRVEIDSRSGRPVRGGRYWFERSRSGFLELLSAPIRVSGRFEGADFEQGGLAPGAWLLRVELHGGDRVEVPLELEVGERTVLVRAP